MGTPEQREAFMERAIELTRQKAVEEGEGMPFAAVIVKEGEIIAEGWNRVLIDYDPTCHGEVDAIRKACVYLKSSFLNGCEMYTSCEPCSMCASVVWYSRLDRVYYANKGSNMTDECDYGALPKDLQLPTDSRTTPYQQLPSLEQKAHKVFQDWVKAYPDDPSLHGRPY